MIAGNSPPTVPGNPANAAALLPVLYHPVEIEIVRQALGLNAVESTTGLDLWNQAGALSPGTIHLEPSADGHRDEDSSQGNALARLVLSGIEDRLRAYLYRTANGDIASARKPRVRRKAQVQTFLLPLFEINWANSAPGVSWPEAYHVGWLPVFNVWVVTASQDSTEMYGHCDRTIGQFPECADTVAAACQVIEGNWQLQYQSWGQEQWEELVSEGRVSGADAYAMAARVWGPAPDDETQHDENIG